MGLIGSLATVFYRINEGIKTFGCNSIEVRAVFKANMLSYRHEERIQEKNKKSKDTQPRHTYIFISVGVLQSQGNRR